jgi:arylsulfatase A-like enzyme
MDIFSTVVDISGAHLPKSIQLDGITLKPFLTGAKTGNPHNQLFWRKEGMAAMRENDFKMIRVDSLGYRLYNLDNDIGEKDDLCEKENNRLVSLQQEMQQWEKGLIEPLWLESDEWNEVTWWVHRDLYFNHEVQVKSPGELEILRLKSDE